MPKCWICGEVATIFTERKWWCEHHYELKKKKREGQKKAISKDLQKLPSYENEPSIENTQKIKLGLGEV